VVGNTPIEKGDGSKLVFYIGSEGWLAKLSRQAPVGSGSSRLPFAAGVAACIAVANLFRYTFRESLGEVNYDDGFILSLVILAPN